MDFYFHTLKYQRVYISKVLLCLRFPQSASRSVLDEVNDISHSLPLLGVNHKMLGGPDGGIFGFEIHSSFSLRTDRFY